jgi:hypothetical protein
LAVCRNLRAVCRILLAVLLDRRLLAVLRSRRLLAVCRGLLDRGLLPYC